MPHVSVKPRFVAEDGRVASDLIPLITRLADRHRLTPFAAALTGPKLVDKTLLWMECMPGMVGYDQFRAFHFWLEDALAAYVTFDSTGQDFRFDAFRPHMTIGWSPRCDPDWLLYRSHISREGSFTEIAFFRRICLFRYVGDPHYSQIGVQII
jgi:hypothetical protein